MSVNRTDYIVYGWKLPVDLKNLAGNKIMNHWDDEKYLPYVEGHPGIDYTLIIDQMCGNYIVFGKIISTQNENGWGFKHLDFAKLNSEEAKAKYREIFELEKDEPIGEPYLFIFSHFS